MSRRDRIQVTETDLHPHLFARMAQRGVTRDEIERTRNEGWEASDARPGTFGRTLVFEYHAAWEGRYYDEKEVTVKARYGQGFARGGGQ